MHPARRRSVALQLKAVFHIASMARPHANPKSNGRELQSGTLELTKCQFVSQMPVVARMQAFGGAQAGCSYVEFFTISGSNLHTCGSYARACAHSLAEDHCSPKL